jgi:hypothetical protein
LIPEAVFLPVREYTRVEFSELQERLERREQKS